LLDVDVKALFQNSLSKAYLSPEDEEQSSMLQTSQLLLHLLRFSTHFKNSSFF
jgi:hypothetical protein